MDPDLDPNLQHWQDRLDSLQWVIGRYSLRSTACQPDHRRDRSSNPFGCPGPVDCRRGRVCACRGSADALVYRLGSVSDQCLISGLVNAALVWAAARWTTSSRVAALPLWAWLLTVAAMSFGGPGDDVILGGQGLLVYGALVFVVAGAVPPAWVLWRRRVQADGSG